MLTKIHQRVLLSSLFLVVFSSYAQQDPQYTQYMYNTINVNPAYAGSRGVLSVFGLYCTQWVGLDGAPDTGVFSVHSPVGERVGLGLSFVNDRIGISDESAISVDFSYAVPVFNNNFKLAFGLKATGHLLNIDFSKLNWHNLDDPTNQNINNRFSPNIVAGAYLYSDRFYVGLSVPNILDTKHNNDIVLESLAK